MHEITGFVAFSQQVSPQFDRHKNTDFFLPAVSHKMWVTSTLKCSLRISLCENHINPILWLLAVEKKEIPFTGKN